jgi:hypothetical protein
LTAPEQNHAPPSIYRRVIIASIAGFRWFSRGFGFRIDPRRLFSFLSLVSPSMLAARGGVGASASVAGNRVAAVAGRGAAVAAESASSLTAANQSAHSVRSNSTHSGSYLGASNQFPASFYDENTVNVDRRGLGKNALPKSWKPSWQPIGQNVSRSNSS